MLAFELGEIVDQLLGQACIGRQPVAVMAMPRKEMQTKIERRKRVPFFLARIRFLHQVIELAAGALGRGLDMDELTGVNGAERAGFDFLRLVGSRALILPYSDTCRTCNVPPRCDVPTWMLEPFSKAISVVESLTVGTRCLSQAGKR